MPEFFPREIITDSDPLLRQKSVDVSLPLSKEDEETLHYMLHHLEVSQDDELSEKYGLRPGVGLAAPQLGILKKMIAIRLPYHQDDGTTKIVSYALINPKIISHSIKKAYLEGGEGCLSVPNDIVGYVYRYANISVKAYDYFTKQERIFKFRGYEAIVAQHEIDHLQGILYYDYIDENNPFKKVNGAIAI